MSANSSSSSYSSPSLSLNDCFHSRTIIFIYLSFIMTNILLLVPVFLLILCVALQRWRRQRCSSAAETMSHSDFFTYNVVALELNGILGSTFYCFAAYFEDQPLRIIGSSICTVTSSGQTLFHVLTCVERYLAVVHPIAYLGLKRAGGVRIINISTGCVWLLCFGLSCCSLLHNVLGSIMMSCLMVFSLIVVSFSGFSILCVLNVPGPGQVSGDRERVDRAKLRAFHTIVAIMAALLLRFVGFLVCIFLFTPPALTETKCAVGASAIWLTLPCSLVLPLLFLQRAGKLPGRTRSSESG